MNLMQVYFTNHRNYRNPKKITPKGIMIHDTGADNPNLCRYVAPDNGRIGPNKYNNHWNKAEQVELAHAFVGKLKDGSVGCVNVLPWNYRAYHCGGSANDTHISIEICRDFYDKDYFELAYQETIELCAYLCCLYGLDPMNNILCHADGHRTGIASNHGDVLEWFPHYEKTMDTFRLDVFNKMYGGIPIMDVRDEIEKYFAELQDNDANSYSLEARHWAINKGIVSGGTPLPDGTPNYMWQSPITREQLVTILYQLHLKGML